MNQKIVGAVIATMLIGGSVAHARNNRALFGAVAAIAATAAIANHYNNSHSNKKVTHRKYKKSKKSYTKRNSVSHKHKSTTSKKRSTSTKKVASTKKAPAKAKVVTSDMKIQKTLVALGLYGGAINGDLNTFESRTAIKKLNEQFGISNVSSLDKATKDQLLYISNLYAMDKDLNTKENTKKAKGKQLQTALKIEEAYTGKIDGAIGTGTRKAIAVYKIKKGMVPDTTLTDEERFELLTQAAKDNKKNIKEALAALKVAPDVTPVSEAPTKIAVNEKKVETTEPKKEKVVDAKAVSSVEPESMKATVKDVHEEEDDFAMPDA